MLLLSFAPQRLSPDFLMAHRMSSHLCDDGEGKLSGDKWRCVFCRQQLGCRRKVANKVHSPRSMSVSLNALAALWATPTPRCLFLVLPPAAGAGAARASSPSSTFALDGGGHLTGLAVDWICSLCVRCGVRVAWRPKDTMRANELSLSCVACRRQAAAAAACNRILIIAMICAK
jgi:hypothetical protein